MTLRLILQSLLVIAVLALGAVAGVQILNLEPAASKANEEDGNYNVGHKDHRESEDHTQIDPKAAMAAGVKTAKAGPARIRETLILQGQVEYDAARVRRVMARYPGIVLQMNAEVGDRVEAGEPLAEVESSDSLRTYAVRAPISGIVTERFVNPGETTNSRPLYVIVDFSRVWVDLAVFHSDLARVQVGLPVRVRSLNEEPKTTGKIGYITPSSSTLSQSVTARIYLDNPRGFWRPGMAVTGEVVVREETVPLAVRNSALQTYEEANVVFVKNDDTYKARKLKLGRTNGEYTEVLSGLEAGREYVVQNSYLIKAELEKSSAEHVH